MTTPEQLLNKILQDKSQADVAKWINVSTGTVKRWVQLEKVPKMYTFELLKMSGEHIDYSLFTYAEKDQFFTPKSTAKYCYSKILETLAFYGDNYNYVYIEPSAGNGRFLDILPQDRRLGMDIEPRQKEIIQGDFLDWKPDDTRKYIVIGNPPFGLRGQLALKFINHSSEFADYVCFILPQLFESDGKGVPRKRVNALNLVHSENIDTDFETPEGKNIKVNCVFQIWSKFHTNSNYTQNKPDCDYVKIYSLSDGGTPSTTRNKKMFNDCDIYLPSTVFGKENMKWYNSFDELPRRKGYGIKFTRDAILNVKKFKEIVWSDVAFMSTNSAYNIRTSQILNELI